MIEGMQGYVGLGILSNNGEPNGKDNGKMGAALMQDSLPV